MEVDIIGAKTLIVNQRIKLVHENMLNLRIALMSHFSPPMHAEDEVSFSCNVYLLKEEMAKLKPQADILKELMRRTFHN